MLLRKTELHFPRSKAFIRFGIEFQNSLSELLLFSFSGRRLMVNILVVSAPVHIQDPAKNGNAILFGKSLDRF